MKNRVSALLLVLAFSVPVMAGEIPIPPAPPACTENCTRQATAPMSPIPAFVVHLVIKLLG